MQSRILWITALLCFSFFLFSLGARIAPNLIKDWSHWLPGAREAKTEKISSNRSPSPTESQEGFTVTINGVPYRKSATISPDVPITAYFSHPDSRVTRVKMQHPQNPLLRVIYPVNREVGIQNHSAMMSRGVLSASDFVALDDRGREYGKIRLVFKPHTERTA